MHAIGSMTSSLHHNAAGCGGQAAMTGGGLPDFAALLGMALTLNKLERALGAGAQATAGTTQGTKIDFSATSDEAGVPEAGMAEGQDGSPGESGETAAALMAAAAPAPSRPHEGKTDVRTANAAGEAIKLSGQRGTAIAAGTGIAGNTGQRTVGSQGEAFRTWNVRELGHQIRAVLGSAVQGTDAAQAKADATGTPATASFLTQAQGDKMRAEGTQNLLRPLTGRVADAERELPLAAVNGQGGVQEAGEPFLSMAGPRLKAPHAVAAALAGGDDHALALDEDTGEAGIAGEARQVVEFAPRAVAAGTADETRMPGLIEQVQQVADFLAERTEGVIRMGQGGVEANLKLYPPDLGGVRVQLNMAADGTTQAQFIVERVETAQLLQQHLRSFQQGLEGHGLTVDRVQVSVQSAARTATADGGWRHGTGQETRRESLAGEQRGNPNGGRRGEREGAWEGK